MLFLVEGTIYTSYYMCRSHSSEKEIRLVEAESEEEARQKFIKYFDKTSEYSVYYSVDAVVHPVIR